MLLYLFGVGRSSEIMLLSPVDPRLLVVVKYYSYYYYYDIDIRVV